MRKLTDREIRFLCWKIKRGKRLPDVTLAALLAALVARRRRAPLSARASNDNALAARFKCRRKAELYRLYEQSLCDWMKKMSALRKRAGQRTVRGGGLWRQVSDTRAELARARRDYESHLAGHGCGNPGGCGEG